ELQLKVTRVRHHRYRRFPPQLVDWDADRGTHSSIGFLFCVPQTPVQHDPAERRLVLFVQPEILHDGGQVAGYSRHRRYLLDPPAHLTPSRRCRDAVDVYGRAGGYKYRLAEPSRIIGGLRRREHPTNAGTWRCMTHQHLPAGGALVMGCSGRTRRMHRLFGGAVAYPSSDDRNPTSAGPKGHGAAAGARLPGAARMPSRGQGSRDLLVSDQAAVPGGGDSGGAGIDAELVVDVYEMGLDGG